jgi:signal transduction histidine kinase
MSNPCPKLLPNPLRVHRYGVAFAAVSVALGIRWLFTPLLGDGVPYLQFFPAVMVAGYYGGLGPGLAATLASALLADYLFLAPTQSLWVAKPADALSLFLYTCSGGVISLLNAALHRAREQAASAAIRLKETVQEREGLIDQLQGERERLELAHETLHTQNEELQCQSEELESQSEELRVQNLELVEQHRQRSQFLAMLAHELRNPLAPIIVAAELLRQRSAGDPVLERQQEIIARQAHHLARMVDDLLDVSRVTQGKISLRRERVEISEAVEQALQICRPLIEEREHELSLSLPVQSITLEADPTRLVQVICNLVNNAARYTERGGKIWLTITRERSELTLRVKDTGRGISPDLLSRVFDLFVQADDSPSRPTGGLGVGLTLVRSLVQQHGGTVRAESDGDGAGSEFIVRLPVLPSSTHYDQSGKTTSAVDSVRFGARILVVDDNRDAAETLAELLDLSGYEVRAAFDGRSGLDVADEFRPEVVFMDLGMPGLDGFETATQLRATEHGRSLLLIAVTGYGAADDRRRTRECGFDAHLTKPIDPKSLLQLLRSGA